VRVCRFILAFAAAMFAIYCGVEYFRKLHSLYESERSYAPERVPEGAASGSGNAAIDAANSGLGGKLILGLSLEARAALRTPQDDTSLHHRRHLAEIVK
jgi:hypothetical protein